jgi:anti-sigma regulatory factor (Ser/Thr protein kinase)
MDNQVVRIRDFILKQISNHPHDLVSHTMAQFKVSRTTVLRHIQYLIHQNKIIKTGNTKQITYALTASLDKQLTVRLNNKFDEFECFTRYFSDVLKKNLNQAAYVICEYVMTELLNNCKDHSQASKTIIQTHLKNDVFHCSIEDNGEGLFKTIQDSAPWDDMRDILFELSKGKLTRDPMNHTGEGIFFSSRAVDRLSIFADGYQFIRDNLEQDWTFCESSVKRGTRVEFEISKKTERNLDHIFESYTHDLSFDKTDILVDLSQHFGERLISRSQAKRVCRRLENFTYITLDFKKVEAVGQGFVDQLFRIYQREYPNTVIRYINANTSVDFMIKRVIKH